MMQEKEAHGISRHRLIVLLALACTIGVVIVTMLLCRVVLCPIHITSDDSVINSCTGRSHDW